MRVNLLMMRRVADGGSIANCSANYRYERYVNGSLVVSGPGRTRDACVIILDLATKHPFARGFRKGFAGSPYGYLAAGEYGVVARLNMLNFTLAGTDILNLQNINPTYGGYSGGFTDGSWACFVPYRESAGSHGGIRSAAVVDQNTLASYFSSVMVCVNSTIWTITNHALLSAHARQIDFGDLDPNLRGYSDAIRVGRYAYITPLASYIHTYTSRLVRVSLGPVDIATTLDGLSAIGKNARNMLNVLDLSQKDPALKGFSGLFSGEYICMYMYMFVICVYIIAGKYLFLVPYRNYHTPQTGQRGFGKIVRIDMNNFALSGIDSSDMTTTLRVQIPSFADIDLRCFTAGFACMLYM